jgi:chemotaxis protein MotA
MDIATLVGLIGAFSVIIAAVLVGGSPLIFINLPSILIVVGGSTMVVAVKFSIAQITKAVGIAAKAFFAKVDSPDQLIDTCYKLADEAKKGGVLALEKMQIDNSFLKRGIAMSVDGIAPELIRSSLETEKSQMMARHEEGQRIFKSLADVSPAMGMIGTLIGLVQMLSNMEDPKSIGPAMAVALLTTLYGAVIANVFATPIADKLGLRSAEEERNCEIIIDAIEGINAGINARVVRDALLNYLPKSQRPTEEKEAA